MAQGTAGRAHQPGCGPCPGGAAAGSPRLLSCQPCIQYHTGSLNEAKVRGLHPPGAGTLAFISMSLPSGSALLPSLLAVSRQGQTFQEKAWSHIWCVRGAWACSLTGSVCQADQNRSCHTGDTGNRFPWASTASSIIWK